MQKKVLIMAGILIIAFTAMVSPVMAATRLCYNFRKSPGVDESHSHRYHYRVEFKSISSQPLTNSTAVTMTVKSNDRSWVVSAKDGIDNSKTSCSAGKMAEWTGTAYNTTSIFHWIRLLVGATTASWFYWHNN